MAYRASIAMSDSATAPAPADSPPPARAAAEAKREVKMEEHTDHPEVAARQDQHSSPKPSQGCKSLPPSEWPAKARLDLMPTELLRSIVGWVNRPTDLKSLCLTSKLIRQVATPPLYRSMHLFVGGPKDKKLSAFLKPSNPGVKEVREIYLRLEKLATPARRPSYSDDSSDEEEEFENAEIPARQAQFTVRLLLDHLPENQLELFSWQNWEPLDVENFELLCRTQKALRCVELGPMDRDLEALLATKPDMFDKMTKVTSVDVYPDSVDRLNAAHRLLRAKPGIEQLTVSTGFEYSREDAPPDLDDSSTRPGLLTRTLFSHMMPFENCQPYRRLKNVDLDTVDLRYCADTWCKIIAFVNLEKLEVRNCAGAEMLWAQVSKPHQRPLRLKTLRWMDDDKSEQPALEAFDNFVECISNLETLHVFISKMNRLPKVAPMIAHKNTLESLSIHSQLERNKIWTYSELDYDQLCRECKLLRQLSINFPKTAADAATTTAEFTTFLDTTLTKLPHLRTLNIRRWPQHRDSFNGSTATRVVPTLRLYEMHLQRISQQIFEKSDAEAAKGGFGHGHRSSLSVVCWGGNGRSRHESNDKYKLKQIPFVRGAKIDAFGERSLLAVQTIWRQVWPDSHVEHFANMWHRLIRFVEPASDILNHSLYDMHEVSDLSQVRDPIAAWMINEEVDT